MNTLRLAVAGKGGSGKTTFAALAVQALVTAGYKPVLAVDADPDADLGEMLGLAVERTVADILAETARDRRSRPGGMSRDEYLAHCLRRAAAGPAVDLLAMGVPEGAGCYCRAHNVLRGFIEQRAADYAALVVDNQAGLEPLSRGTTREADLLFVISNTTVRDVRAAGRINRLARRLDLGIRNICLVLNRVRPEKVATLGEEIVETGLEIGGLLPHDPAVGTCGLLGRPLTVLPDDSPAAAAVREIIRRTVLRGW